MTKSPKKEENYLSRVPVRADGIGWSADEEGIVTLHIDNKGIMCRITQLRMKKPKVSHVHLDEIGSFLWLQIDGEKDLCAISEPFSEKFGERVEPLYDRLSQFFSILASNRFIKWKE